MYPTLTEKVIVEIKVIDSGIGLLESELKLLF
jgi:hypothetical protein